MKNNNYMWSLFLFVLFLVSCKQDFDVLFNQMINEEKIVILEHPDYSSVINNAYIKIYKLGKKNNKKLLELAINENSTTWVTNIIERPLTDGDLAISLLVDINEISDADFYYLMPLEIGKEYDKNGVFVFWDWIHENKNNRLYVINQLKKIII